MQKNQSWTSTGTATWTSRKRTLRAASQQPTPTAVTSARRRKAGTHMIARVSGGEAKASHTSATAKAAQKSTSATREGRERDQDAREVDALHEVLARDDAVRGGEDSECDELPRKKRREGCQGVGSAGGVEVAELPEEEREHTGEQQRLQDGPEHADRALLVADGQIPPGEEGEQLARVDHLAQALGAATDPRRPRFDHEWLQPGLA